MTLPLPFLAQVYAKLPNVLDGLKATLVQLLAADPLIKLPDTIDSIYLDKKSGPTLPGNRTKLYGCQNQTIGFLLFYFVICSESQVDRIYEY